MFLFYLHLFINLVIFVNIMFREYKVQEKLLWKTIAYLDLRSSYLSILEESGP